MLPALQKTWQGGTTLGGNDLVNQVISEASSELTARTALLAIKNALTTFNLNPWTVVSSSNGVVADNSDNWASVADLVYPTTFGTAYSWIVLKQTNITGTFEVLLSMFDILATDPDRQNLMIKVAAGGGYVAGSINVQPFAPGGDVTINGSGDPWLGSMTTAASCVVSCIESSDGQCTRIVISDPDTGQGFTAFGFEVPRLPNPAWSTPWVAYFLGDTIASGLDCLRRAVMQETTPFHVQINNLTAGKLVTTLRMTGPQRSTAEVIDEIQQSIYLWGGGLFYDGVDAQNDWGTLFDWYWVNRNIGGAHALYGDSFPSQVDGTPQNAVFFPLDAAGPTSSLERAGAAATNLRFTADMTLECWVDISSLNAGQGDNVLFAGKGVFSFGYLFFIKELNGDPNLLRLDIKYSNSNGSLASQSVNGLILVDTWAHVACTREKATGELKLFLNGVQIGSTLVDDIGADIGVETNNPWQLGNKQDSASADHHGYMAEARAWSIVRTPAEILANYDKTLVGNEAGLQGYWPLHTDFNDLTANAYHLTGTAGNGTPAPAITARALPYTGALEDLRTFVCAGDVVWGWLDDSVTDLSAFNWSGKFDIMPADTLEMETMLGIDGSESADLGNLSHEWRIGLGGVNGVVDGGTLTSGIFNMGSAAGTPQYLSNSDYELGAAGREVFTIDGDDDAVATSGGQTTMVIPADPMTSAFRSFLYTIAFTPSAANDGAGIANRMLLHNREVSSIKKGWRLSYQNNNGGSPRRLVALLAFDGVVEDVMISSFTFAYDLPVFAVVVHDFADNKMKMVVAQGSTIQYDEFTMTLSGSFLANDRLVFGKSPAWHPNWGGSSYGAIAQVSTFEWDAAIPSGFTRENVKRYLQYTDGILP
jgi:hypothetical protein